MRVWKTIFIIILILAASKTFGISYDKFRTIQEKDGLPSNTVGAILRDWQGFVWIGTKFGPARFDGIDIRRFPHLPKDDIWTMEELGGDTMLIGTVSHLKLFSRKTGEYKDIPIEPTIVKAIRRISDSKVLVGTETGLYLLGRNLVPQKITIETGMNQANHITSILKEDKNIYWFTTADGLGRIDIRTNHTEMFRMPKGIDNSNFFICMTRYGHNLYLGSFNKGVFSFDMANRRFSKLPGFEHNLILSIAAQDGKIFVGTNGLGLRICNLKGGDIETVTHNSKLHNSLGSNTVTALLIEDGILWVGTQFGGISYVPRSEEKFKVYTCGEFYSSDYRVTSFLPLRGGLRLIGTRNGLFLANEATGTVRKYSTKTPHYGLRSDIITYINKIEGRIFIGTFGGGIHIFDEETHTLRNFSDNELGLYGCIFHIEPDKQGNLWIGTQEGLYHTTISGKVLKNYNTYNSPLTTSAVFQVRFDRLGRVWVGTKFGLYILDAKTGKMSAHTKVVPARAEINYIANGRDGNMWICSNMGLYCINMNFDLVCHYDKNALLPDDRVISIFEEKSGLLWVVTSKAVTKLQRKNKSAITYMKQDGLGDADFNRNVFCENDSVLWWTNEGGLFRCGMKDSPKMTSAKRKPKITGAEVGDMDVCLTGSEDYDGMVEAVSGQMVTIHFSSMDYSLPYSNSYEYMLEGYDREWHTQTGKNSVAYPNLPSGDYIFKVRQAGGGEEVAQLAVTVHRSYKYVAIGGIMLLIVLAVLWYFIHNIKNLKARMHAERSVRNTGKSKNTLSATEALPMPKDNELADHLSYIMQSEKPYLNAKVTVKDVAAMLTVEEAELSYLLNTVMNTTWANYINTFRVEEFKSRLTPANLSKFTLLAISGQCGFANKATFYRVFKQITGMTPLEYCRSNGISETKTD